MKRFMRFEIIVPAAMILLLIGYFCFQTSRGYHLKWSPANGRHIWVDKDGKP